MSKFLWDEEKNKKIKEDRGISFEEVISYIESGHIVDVIDNPSKNHLGQLVYVVEIKDYIYFVPHVKKDEVIFLKTIIPSRKATKTYLKKESES